MRQTLLAALLLAPFLGLPAAVTPRPARPNILIAINDYAANFADFLGVRPKDRPFYFWYGATEPHRGCAKGSGLQAGKRL